MKNIAVIFAGGSGKRMNTVSRPKQFLDFFGKPFPENRVADLLE